MWPQYIAQRLINDMVWPFIKGLISTSRRILMQLGQSIGLVFVLQKRHAMKVYLV